MPNWLTRLLSRKRTEMVVAEKESPAVSAGVHRDFAFIVADPTKRVADQEADGESRFVRSCRLLALLLGRSGYNVQLKDPFYALRAVDLLLPLRDHLEAWKAAGGDSRFILFICGHGTTGGIEMHPDPRVMSSRGCCGRVTAVESGLVELLESLYERGQLEESSCGWQRHLALKGEGTILPFSVLFRLLARYPGKKAVVVEACKSGSFVPALLQVQPRELIVVSASGASQPAYGQRMVQFLAESIRDGAPLELRAILDCLPGEVRSQAPDVWSVTAAGEIIAAKDYEFFRRGRNTGAVDIPEAGQLPGSPTFRLIPGGGGSEGK